MTYIKNTRSLPRANTVVICPVWSPLSLWFAFIMTADWCSFITSTHYVTYCLTAMDGNMHDFAFSFAKFQKICFKFAIHLDGTQLVRAIIWTLLTGWWYHRLPQPSSCCSLLRHLSHDSFCYYKINNCCCHTTLLPASKCTNVATGTSFYTLSTKLQNFMLVISLVSTVWTV